MRYCILVISLIQFASLASAVDKKPVIETAPRPAEAKRENLPVAPNNMLRSELFVGDWRLTHIDGMTAEDKQQINTFDGKGTMLVRCFDRKRQPIVRSATYRIVGDELHLEFKKDANGPAIKSVLYIIKISDQILELRDSKTESGIQYSFIK